MSDPYVSRSKQARLAERMRSLGIEENDLVERFILGSGRGGQKINKTHSCVHLKHVPSGIEIRSQATRSRELNRFHARVELCEQLEEKLLGEQSKRKMEEERIRRQKRRRTRRQKQRMLEEKHRQSEKKILRKPVNSEAEE